MRPPEPAGRPGPEPAGRPGPEQADRPAPGAAGLPPTRRAVDLPRFAAPVRWVHRAFATAMGICVATAAVLYDGRLAVAVGHRSVVEAVHIAAGIALPLIVAVGWVSGSLRADLRRLDRFTRVDWLWLRDRQRRDGGWPVGKFNAGQKLNASVVAGATLVLLGTGLIMRFANGWPVRWRTGATFVHDWVAYAVAALVAGHLWFAARDREARRGMRTGRVDLGWARREHPGWVEELAGRDEGPAGAGPPDQPGPATSSPTKTR